ncbi:sodium-dependent dicarboxylate transporter 2/3/5 [Halanaerobium saccharolyticum]|uniref:Sodium-dependent dicarboxylate transporter SdcS n=1 Tax=Halanaerobium saccharolyticum TaxID=43595 RepID=A0A4R7Z6E9_9FIRM|nr:DASS family sodium-coupled anion symporter [Halanaerobium saccharolyticum]RAK12447.1 sodium-dependent dicarboxylate transporter 2/3/5 [Halanaerobium saccharolyticum]TDW06373.1 sodium-dependent dicarboxylate transporter 2/3/5 [Halanaerobium saccharolyticum]TDX61621.1 sodium-dependent dicarboxylate transporter 2/3/5 [Halanaerobium saccharolyticum]
MLKYLKEISKYAGLIFFIILLIMPPFAGLNPAGQRALAVFVLVLSFWVTHVLPLSVTSLLGIALLPLLNVMSLEYTFSLFGSKAIFFILGALILASGLYQTGLGSRLAFKIISFSGSSPLKLLYGILFTAAFLSLIMPEHAVAALLFPIVLEIAVSLDLKPLESNYGKLLFLTMAWGTVIGGITTYLGGARNLLAVGLLEKHYGITIGFFEWIKYSWPLPFLLLIVFAVIITKFADIDISDTSSSLKKLKAKSEARGNLSGAEKRLIVILGLVVFSWLFLSNLINIAITALLGGVLIVAFKVVSWKEVEEYVNWGVILMYGGAIVVASSLVETGVTDWMAARFFSQLELAPFLFIFLLAIFTSILTEGVSNIASVAVILPLAFSAAEAYSLNPILLTLSVALSGGLAFLLPMGTPPNAIAFSSGYYQIKDALKWGLLLKVIGWLIYILVARFYWPLIGLETFI